ncbi:hypothetical protein FRC17_010924 [Serendipita sp. 399]|nr:hypothetical protein FRC17_010924 [Serendipita sp. 399]
MPWIVAMLGYVLSGLAWIEFGLVAYYRHLSRKPFAAAPQNKIIAKPHTWWILGLILGGMILAYLALGGSLGDGAYGGYNLWIVPALVILTEALHATALPLWKGTAKNRRGTINPPFIYSITLLVLLSLLASAWTAAGVISFFILTGKLDNSKYITWSTYFKTGNAALPYVRWTTAGLAVGVAILTWAQFGVTLWYRIKFFKKVKNALGNSQPAANNANATNNTANNANSNNNTNTTSSNANANTHSEVNALYSQSTTHLNPYNPFTNNQYPQSTPSIPNTPYTTPYPPGQLYPTASQQNLPYAHPDYAAPAYTPAQNTGYNPVYQPASHPMNPFFQRDTSV